MEPVHNFAYSRSSVLKSKCVSHQSSSSCPGSGKLTFTWADTLEIERHVPLCMVVWTREINIFRKQGEKCSNVLKSVLVPLQGKARGGGIMLMKIDKAWWGRQKELAGHSEGLC